MLGGIGLKILSTLLFTLMNALGRAESATFPTGEIVFFRSWPALLVLIAWLHWRGEFPGGIATRRPFGHLLRGFIGSGGMFFGFATLAFLPLADAVAIGFATPLIGVALAAWILKERVRAYRWSAVGVGFIGVVVMLYEHLGADPVEGSARAIGSTLALIGAVCSAGAMTQTRRLTQTEQTGAIVFYFSLLTTVLGALSWFLPALLPKIASGQVWLWPPLFDVLRLGMMGILGGVAQIAMTESYRRADASVVAAFDYTSMIWAVTIGYVAFGDLPSRYIVIGAGIVILSGVFVIWREHRLGLLRGPNAAT